MPPDDQKIIKFPGTPFKLTGQVISDPVVKLAVGPMTFTCTNCGDTCHADFKHMVFRSLEFYCSGCGNHFKVTNPAFSGAPAKTKK